MRIGYADPPYPGMAEKHYGDHPDYGGEVDHYELLKSLANDFDGWVLHTGANSLGYVAHLAEELGISCRYMAWVKPFAAFKANVPVAYAWEPVLVHECRTPIVNGEVVMRDWFSEPITMKRGLAGAKPFNVCVWLFHVLGAEPTDELVDLFPGTGAVTEAWEAWCNRPRRLQDALDFGSVA